MKNVVDSALLLYTAVVYAFLQASYHAPRIKEMTMTRAYKLKWTGVRIGALLGIGTLFACTGSSWVGQGLAVCGAELLFSTIFRDRLARLLDWDPDYMGSTAVYDRLWIWAFTGNSPKHIQEHHDRDYAYNKTYHDRVLAAGRFATIAEVAASGCLIAVAGMAAELHLP